MQIVDDLWSKYQKLVDQSLALAIFSNYVVPKSMKNTLQLNSPKVLTSLQILLLLEFSRYMYMYIYFAVTWYIASFKNDIVPVFLL